jgi:hypothetical protein
MPQKNIGFVTIKSEFVITESVLPAVVDSSINPVKLGTVVVESKLTAID